MNTQQTMHTLNAALFEYEENYFNLNFESTTL